MNYLIHSELNFFKICKLKAFFSIISGKMNYTNQEMADIHYFYGMAEGIGLAARELYREQFPERRIPHHATFSIIDRRLRETGQFNPPHVDAGRARIAHHGHIEDDILARVAADPAISVRRLVAEFDVSIGFVWNVIHRAGYYPYHLQRVQALYFGDHIQRTNFCNWFLNQQPYEPVNFAWHVLYTDEAQFTRDGINNFHNQHLWDMQNPHGIIEGRHQRTFSCNVWGGIVGDQLLGPVFFPPRLNGAAYQDFLTNQLEDLFENVQLRDRRRMWFQHDGAPAHFSRGAREILNRNDVFHNRWIGRAGPVAWPPRSPDLTPLDFFLWGYCKALVYSVPVINVEELRERINNAFETIRNTAGIFQRVNHNIYRRYEACVEMDGGHFEHLL